MSADNANFKVEKNEATRRSREVVVADMDRTLLASDLTMESLLALIGKSPQKAPALIGWMLSGRPILKKQLAEHAVPDLSLVPANPEIIDYLRAKKDEGAHIVLASASNEKIVQAVAERFGLFDEVFGSNAGINLKGSAKADGLDQKFGKGGYTYIGDSPADLKVWSRAGKAVTAGVSPNLQKKAEAAAPESEHISLASRSKAKYFKGLIKAMRPHQWSKNILLFVPLLAAHALTAGIILDALIGFAAFSLTASSVYLVNDMLDLDSDRAHPRKRNRPFASGVVPLKDGMMLAPLLLVMAFGISTFFLPPIFVLVLGGYFLATLSYSLWLKQKIMVDVFLLAGLYTFRILAGGAATLIPMSPWLIGFSIFFFLALAITKRIAEVVDIAANDTGRKTKRDYSAVDLGMIQALGAAAGFSAVLVLILYFSSPEASNLYKTPEILWGVAPLVLFWISRMLVLANRGNMDDDPIVFAAKDRTSIIVGLCAGAVILAAINISI